MPTKVSMEPVPRQEQRMHSETAPRASADPGRRQLGRRSRHARMGAGRWGPSLALLIDHDDADREFQYTSTAATSVSTEPITDVGARLGWTIVSIARDWDVVFPPESAPSGK